MPVVEHLRAGNLDRRITIENLTSTVDSHGGETQTWSTLAAVWAEVIPLSGDEAIIAAQSIPGARIKFRIRWRSDVTETARVIYEGRNYDIAYIAEIGRREGLELLGKNP